MGYVVGEQHSGQDERGTCEVLMASISIWFFDNFITHSHG
jgi:hypothetical protein